MAVAMAEPGPPMPTWVKVLLGALGLLLAGFLVLHLTGAAPTSHGP
jgi:hypothetical protein